MRRRVLSLIITLTLCLNLCPVWAFAAGEGMDGGLCQHHPSHTDECGYVPESPDEPCTFDCRICPVEDLIGKLPDSVSEDNSEQVQVQLDEIYALYDGLTADEQRQVDLSPCISLQGQLDGAGLTVLSDDPDDSGDDIFSSQKDYELEDDYTQYGGPYEVSAERVINTNEYTFIGADSTAILVTGTGRLHLTGNVISQKGNGVEVQSGGSLSITGSETSISAFHYALNIASGAEVHLSAGTYSSSRSTAIWTEDGNLAALLEPGYAYFDGSGNPLSPAEAANAKTVVISRCLDHSDKVYTHILNATKHTWTCPYCGVTGSEPCTFDFVRDGDGTGTCADCGNKLSIAVNKDDLTDLVYDGTLKPTDVRVTVTLTDPDGNTTELTKGTDFTVDIQSITDAGQATVTVTGITFNGTFVKTYTVEQARPGINWNSATCELDYDGRRTTIKDELPDIRISLSPANNEDLHPYIQYSYRNAGDTEFTDGLPLDAGEYEVKAYIPASQNYEAAETSPLLSLTIKEIDPVTAEPKAAKPTYNGTAQALVTGGTVDSRAVGAEILFAASENGDYSTTIPTGVNAGDDYEVWYKVEGTNNYTAVGPTKIDGVEILRKKIKPVVTLSDYTYLYDGGFKEPKVTVKDEDHVTVLLDTEYSVAYSDNKDVGTAKVTVTDKPGGNYELTQVEKEFQITSKEQETLTITKRPDTVTYGAKFTLETSGGAGNGIVTWEITDGADVAEIDEDSGQVTVIGHGSATVKATKSGKDPTTGIVNYDDADARWTFTADKKPVVATVTADDKSYDGNDTATIQAVVEQGVLPGDKIEFNGLTGTFSDANAGVDKTVTVTVDSDGKPVDTNGQPVTISGNNSEHYDVSYSSLTVKATIHKAVVHITTAPNAANLTYNGTAQALLSTGAQLGTTGVDVEYALSEDGSYSTDFPKGTNAGKYTVWYRVQETDNYTGLAPAKVEVEIGKKPVTPTIALSGDGLQTDTSTTPSAYFYIYDGNAKEPLVKLTEADGTTIIPADEYTVSYSGNRNVGTATVTVTAKPDGNYAFTPNDPVTIQFEIKKEQARVITAPEAAGLPLYYNTFAQKLVTEGTGDGGTMVYAAVSDGSVPADADYSETIPTKTDAGVYTVYYKVRGDGNHSDSNVGSVTVTIAPKTVKDPTIELLDDDGNPLTSYTYDGTAKKPTVKVLDGSTLIDTDEYNLVYEDNIDAGKGTVNITDKSGGNYTVTGSATFVILKANIVDPAPSAAAIVYDGEAHELLIPGTTSGGTVQYALNSPTSTYTDAIPTAVKAGTYTVYYKVIGDKNHNDFAAKSVSATIQRKPLTAITIELLPDGFAYDGTIKMPEVTVKDGKTVLPEEEYTWSCNDPSPTSVGIYTITISDAAGGNYDLSGVVANNNNTATFTIGQIPQEELVIGGQPATTNYGDSFSLTVSGGSGTGAITWNATGPAEVDAAGNVTINGVGEVTITVEQAADINYLAAQAQCTFTAAPKPVTALVTVSSKHYDGNTDASVASASITTINGDVVTIDKDSIIAVFDTPSIGTGKTVTLDTSKVKVTGDDAAKYAIRYPDTVTADITKETTNITTTPKAITPLTYNGQPQALVTAGVTNVGFLVYSLNENGPYSPEIPTGTDAGTYNVYYKVDGTADYTGVAANTTPISVTIDPKGITPVIEVSEKSYLYDGTKKDPKITVKDDKTVIDENQYTVTWAGTKSQTTAEMLTVADTYTATIKNVTGGNYTFSETVTVEIVAAEQGALHITGQPDHVYYGDTVTTLSTTGGSGNGSVTWSITDGGSNSTITATGKLTVKDTGSITVKAERTVTNYGTVSDEWIFTVEPKPVTAEVTIAPKDYDGTTDIAGSDVRATVKSGDLVDPADSITITGLTGAYDDANAGTGKAVTLDTANMVITVDNTKYTVSLPTDVTADISPRQVDVTVTLFDHDLKTDNDGNYYYVFDGAEKTPAVTVTADDDSATLVSSDYTVSYANNKNVGSTAAVTVKSAAGGNYTFAYKTVNFEIRSGAAVLTSTPQAKALTYDGTAQDLVTVGTATGGTVVYSSTGTAGSYSETIPTETDAGTYTVYYMVKGDTNHDDTAPGQVSVTIKRKEITPKITLDTTSYVYDGTAHTPTVTVEDGNTEIPGPGAAKPEYTLTYRDNINAGTAMVIVSDANGGNYIVNGTATFEIAKAAPVLTTAPEGKTNLQYSGAPQELVKAGVTGHGTVVYSVNGGNFSPAIPTATAVGDYKITYKVLGDDNHKDTDPVTLTPDVNIARNKVTTPAITLSSKQFTYTGGQQKPEITVCDDKGLLIPEHEYTVTITGVNSNDMVDVDTYTVTVTTPDSSNYDIQGNNTRTFEIVAADQETISITGTQAQVRYGETIQLGVTGGTGAGTVTWTVTANDGSTVNSTISATGLLTVSDVGGPFTVTVTRSRGGNYKDVSAAWEFSAAKKQVTAVVTADDRPYAAGDTSATVTATVPDSALVSGDSITISGVTGTFDDPNVGTNKKVTLTGGTVEGTDADKYDVTIPATTTASILAQAATVDTDPTPNTLTYDASQAQALVTAGTATGGIMVYSLDGTNFTASVPTAKDAGTYTVHFKAQGDGNHTDSVVGTTQVTIGKQSVTPQIELTPPGAQYDGQVKRPEVTLRDSANNVIPASEYKITYVSDNSENWTDKGDYTVKIEDISGGNYIVATITEPFTISTTAQNPLAITNKPGLVYYGDTFTLSAVGGSGSAAVTWSVDNTSVVEIDANGFVKIIGTGSATITATKPGGTNYDTVTATYPLNALKKPITAIVTAEDRVYASGDTSAAIHVSWKDGDLVGNDSINISALSGTFKDDSVGTNKTVTITGGPITDSRYDITIPATTASILKADMAAPNVTANDRDYDGTAQPLVTGGTANTTVYSDARDGVYSAMVPTGTNAGIYTVWYKDLGDANHNDSVPQAVTVTISPKKLTLTSADIELSGNDLQKDADGNYSYVYDGTDKEPTVTIKDGAATVPASEYTVTYSGNKNVGTATVTITSSEGGNYTFGRQTVRFEITSAGAQLTSSPQAKDLTYTGQAQELVTVGTATGGHIEYSLDGTNYSPSIPTETGAGTYTVTYKVVGDGNYAASSDTWTVSVTIKPREIISPKVTVTGTYTYNSNPVEPAAANIKVEDGTTTIPASEYTVTFRDNIEAGTATAVITNATGGNYIVNGTGTFTIGKAAATVGTAPAGKLNLPYNGTAQELVTAGSASGGTMVYSLSQTGEYSPAIPAQMAVDNYIVWYKVQGDGNHSDTVPVSVSASIVVNNVTNPTVQVTPESVTYNGKKQEPTVTVIDDNGFTIDGSEYTVTYTDAGGNATTEPTDAGTYTLTITGTDTHYTFNTTATFEILPAGQTLLTITGTRERVYYGDTIRLSTEGGNGTVTWTVDDGALASIANGLLEVKGVGSVTVTATSKAAGYEDKIATWSFYADKKPVTAVVTAVAKEYDGKTDATVTATLQTSDLVSGDTVKITLSGSFEDPNVGTDKKVIVDSTNPDFTGSTANYVNYNITYPPTTTASILRADIDPTKVTAPKAVTGLEYTGLAQVLVEAGSVTGGILEYSTDSITYSTSLPTGTEAGDYNIWYRVKGDSNHNDTAGTKLAAQVTIDRQTVEESELIIEFSPSGASYDSAVHKPTVIVKDKNARIIPDSEYDVDYGSSDWKTASSAAVKHVVTVTGKTGGNYNITTKAKEFTISPAGQSQLSITNQPGTVRYGDTFTLSTTGGSGTGTVSWVSSNPQVATIEKNGLVKVMGSGAGAVTITATKQADGNYGQSESTWSFSVERKPVTAVVTADDKVFNGDTRATLHVTWNPGDLLSGDAIDLESVLVGTFNNANVGDNKTVTITGTVPDSNKYAITYNATTAASITPKAASVSGSTATKLAYNGSEQELVSGVTATNGDLAYSTDGSYYTLLVPKEKNAGKYTIWYKAQASGNYMDSPAVRVDVTIEPKPVNNPTIELSPAIFDYDGTAKKPDAVVKDGIIPIPTSEYTVSYSDNIQAGTAKVTISDAPGGNYDVSGSTTFTIRAATASLTLEPQPRELTYTGADQALVTAGTAVNGRVVYSLEQNGTYTTTIPRKTNADTYEVWYKVQGENGSSDTQPQYVSVTIQPKEVTPAILLNGQYAFSTPYTGGAITPTVTVNVGGEATSSFIPTYSNNTNPGTATVTVRSNGGNYRFFEIVTFEITKGKAEFFSEPEGETGLVYTGEAQELVRFGIGKVGTVVYSLNGGEFYPIIPVGTEVGSYMVLAKVQGGDLYADSDVKAFRVTIDKNVLTEAEVGVTLSPNSVTFTGYEQKPAVTVRNIKDSVAILGSEYTVTYNNNVAVGTASVTVTGTGKNYSFTKTVTFQITPAGQPALTITGKPDTVCYGDTITTLKAEGSSGTVAWSVTGGTNSTIDQTTGRLVVKDAGTITVTATSGSLSDTWSFPVEPKPVTAVVTAADKTYDTNTTADLTFTVSSGLASGDTAISGTAAGYFKDANAGINKTVVITGLTVPDAISAKYDIQYLATTTASITPAPVEVTEAPESFTTLKYTGLPQALVTPGTAANGTMAYSQDGVNYSFTVPEGTDAKTYNVWYKVVATDENHKDSAPVKVDNVAIAVNTDTPTVTCSPSALPYDGTEKTPTVIVLVSGREIPKDEYTVEYPASAITVGKYEVIVKDKANGNYSFSGEVKGTFEIVAASQNPLSIVTDIPTNVHYGDEFRLSAIGGTGSGGIQWKSTNESVATVSGNGVVTVIGTGSFTVEAYREASGSYSQSNTDTLPFHADPKPVTPVVTADDKPFDGDTTATLHASWKDGDLANGDTITLNVGSGQFATPDVGMNKKVTVQPGTSSGDIGNYIITWPDSTTASISKVDAKLQDAPKAVPNLTYTGNAQKLVTAGSTVNNIGTIVYSLSQNGVYSESIPEGTNADKYTVWYKVADSVNYTGIAAAAVEVEIKQAKPSITTDPTAVCTENQKLSDIDLSSGKANVSGKFAWADGSITPVNRGLYDVIFTPDDMTNYEPVTFQITVTVQAASNGGVSGSGSSNSSGSSGGSANTPSTNTPNDLMQTTVRNGTASTVLSTAAGSRLVSEAAANQSRNVVIKPEITSDVTRTEVSIPASTVSQLSSATDADLTVSSPIADVTISNTALDTLSQAGGTVSVAAEQVEQAVVLTLTADGENVEQVPGGLTLTVPVEDAGPGTVAVLVHEDGTRETIRKSLVEDGVMSVPLSGSATVEIVDNSKDFADVSPESWAADAVDFASAHELFSGTSETTFSPDQAMSRGMLATVLYRLDGSPELNLTDAFDDVSDNAWYAEGVAWALENGIASGYGDSQFGPDDSITREQFVVMLWRYAGSPEASGQTLDFTDADQVSGYAQEALCWAVENGILHGVGDGTLDPGGMATRAQAAQLLKSFMENT